MIEARDFLLPIAFVVVGGAAGLALAWWRDVRAAGAEARARRGSGPTAPFLVSTHGTTRRAHAVVDDGNLRILGPRTHLLLEGRGYTSAAVRRHALDEELLEFSTQRGYVDAAGTRYLVGAFEDWEPALVAALERPPRRAPTWRRIGAAAPRALLGATLIASVAFLAVVAVWASGRDVSARMERLLGEEGLESCAVRWSDGRQSRYAEVDCYEPFPEVGAPVRIRALSFPFDGRAMDHEGSWEGLTTVTGGPALISLGLVAGAVIVRLRRPAVRLVAQVAPTVAVDTGDPLTVSTGAPLGELLDALARIEQWSEGVTSAPEQSRWQPHLIALGAGRWWPAAVLGGLALLVDDVPHWLRTVLVVAATGAVALAAARAVTAWRAIRPAYTGAVTSEWDYRLVRLVDDEWLVLLLLGDRPHWVVALLGEGHPPVRGRCGVRGELREGGAVQLRIDGEFWMGAGPVERVDEVALRDLRDEVGDRLVDLGQARPGSGGDGPAQ
ncbi:hypothetical protein ACK8HX_02860 [Oryzobacter sp. R7]|uniref:hypothetical protein n=1 Tax=Oryzobacter faecalis TaxID=3388656 RepID=UPI00398C9D29